MPQRLCREGRPDSAEKAVRERAVCGVDTQADVPFNRCLLSLDIVGLKPRM